MLPCLSFSGSHALPCILFESCAPSSPLSTGSPRLARQGAKIHLDGIRAPRTPTGREGVTPPQPHTAAPHNKSGARPPSQQGHKFGHPISHMAEAFAVWSHHFPVKFSWMELTGSEVEEKNKVPLTLEYFKLHWFKVAMQSFARQDLLEKKSQVYGS